MKKLKNIDDLLTKEQKDQLRADLTKMANQRREAEAASRHIVMH